MRYRWSSDQIMIWNWASRGIVDGPREKMPPVTGGEG